MPGDLLPVGATGGNRQEEAWNLGADMSRSQVELPAWQVVVAFRKSAVLTPATAQA